MRVHYSSVTNSENPLNSVTVSTEPATVADIQSPVSPISDSLIFSKKTAKHASLYVSLLVQPLPKEMLLRPAILDFIDQALNPIVAPDGFENNEHTSTDTRSIDSESEPDPATGSFISSATSEHSSFPVDIVIIARIQPSNIRISCLPKSRVECLMRIPSLDVTYSSKPSPNKSSSRGCPRNQTSTQDVLGSPGPSSIDLGDIRSDSGGISFTICLSRFSLFIYHPYGKQHSMANKTTSFPENGDHLSPKARISVPQPQLISGKKDALSLGLEFIKFNLSRRRFGDVSTASLRKEQIEQASKDEIPVESTLVKVSGLCSLVPWYHLNIVNPVFVF